MKTTVLVLISVFMVLTTIKTTAQVTGMNANPKTNPVKTDVGIKHESYFTNSGVSPQTNKLQLKGVEGEIYIGDTWPIGTIVLRNGGIIDNYYLRYNLLADQMQFVAGKDTLAFASPQELNTITFGGHTFVYENYQCDNFVRQGYFELVVPGKNKLLLKRMVTYRIPDAGNPDDESSTKYLVDECFFISKPGEVAKKMMCNRKSALSVLNNHKDELDQYMKMTGNKVRNAEDLKKLVEYYNALDENK